VATLAAWIRAVTARRLNAKLSRGKWFDAAVSWYDQKIPGQ
jgi:hypothetical protein